MQSDVVGSAGLEQGWRCERGQPIAIRGVVYLQDKRSDMPNRIKHLVDTLAEGLDFDDRYVAELHLVTKYDKDEPRVEVEVEALSRWP